MKLPNKFTNYIQNLIPQEYDAFINSYEASRHYGLRLNRLKYNDVVSAYVKGQRDSVKWAADAYYYAEEDRPAKDPYYYAGAYYIQEPSAMTPATAMDAKPGDRVIDLCAAPGGKTTQMASGMLNQGLLVTNDISHGRVKNLNKNVQISGIRNALVLSEDPVKLCEKWPGFFNKVLIDAPCSGEGMFRKEPRLIGSWEKEGPEAFIEVQRSLLNSADALLEDGGEIVYSTCTYNLEENEKNIVWFLDNYEGYEIVDITPTLGVSLGVHVSDKYDLTKTARVWPHKDRGEGHYIAKLRKVIVSSDDSKSGNDFLNRDMSISEKNNSKLIYKKVKPSMTKEQRDLFSVFLKGLGFKSDAISFEGLNVIKDTLYLLPPIALETKGLRVFANGWLLGTYKKNRFEPSQAFACGLKTSDIANVIDFGRESDEVFRYLKGETITTDAPNGWHLVAVDGLSLGFGKVVNKRLKNKYEATWRWQ